MMKVGVPRENSSLEARVAVAPDAVKELVKSGVEVYVEAKAGEKAFYTDKQYSDAGAKLVKDAKTLYATVDVVLKIQPPSKEELRIIPNGKTIFGLFSVLFNKDLVKAFSEKKMTVFSMELVPRITKAQSMDALSSMSTVAGYKAVVIASDAIAKFFPLLMTAAGTVNPANVLVIGAGVAGLQAIGTAKRLGARVEAFDTRPAVKEQVESLGARFVEMELPKDSETKGGYAKEASEEFIKKEMEAIGSRLPKSDVVICTAQVFGRKAPLLVTEDMVKMMQPGSVIVDLAAEQGGNCALTEPGKTVMKYGVSIIGPVNLPSSVSFHASQMYSRNIVNLFKHIYQNGNVNVKPPFTDEIVKGCCICHEGEIVNELVKKTFSEGGKQK